MLRVYLSTPERRVVGQRYNVEFNGKRILTDILGDPTKRTAQALLNMGHTGFMAVVAESGRTICVVDIEKAARRRGWKPPLERNAPRRQSALSHE